MKISERTSFFALGTAAVCLALALPMTTLAAGGTTNPTPAPQPRPDREKKVWMNEDVARLNPDFGLTAAPKPTVAAPPVAATPAMTVKPSAPAPRTVVTVAPLDPQRDPGWYAQQLDSLESELAAVATREQQLSQFRATSAGLPTGLVLNAPCEGITTDNLIAQLDARRRDILEQIDALSDTARSNDLPPGVLVEGRGRLELATQASTEDQRAALSDQVRSDSDEVAQIQEAVAGMQQQLSAQGISMLPSTPGNGGNMTTNLVDGLDNRATDLSGEISEAEDAARTAGVAPGDLR
jgi:hypothetical protein